MWSYLTLCGVDARAVVAAEGVKVSWCQCEWWRVNRLHSDAATAAAAAPPPHTFRGFSAQRLQPQLMSNIFTGFKIFLRCQYLALQCRQRCCLLTGGWRWMAEVRAVDGGGGVVQQPGPALEALMSLDSIAVTPSTAPASPCTITILSSGYLK